MIMLIDRGGSDLHIGNAPVPACRVVNEFGRGSGSPQPVAIRVVTGAPKMAPGAGRIYDF